MKVSLTKCTNDAQDFEVVTVAFDGYGYRMRRPAAEKLLEVLESYFDGSLSMGPVERSETKLVRSYSDEQFMLLDERPANQQGQYTNGTLLIQINDNGYFTLSDNDVKELLLGLERELTE